MADLVTAAEVALIRAGIGRSDRIEVTLSNGPELETRRLTFREMSIVLSALNGLERALEEDAEDSATAEARKGETTVFASADTVEPKPPQRPKEFSLKSHTHPGPADPDPDSGYGFPDDPGSYRRTDIPAGQIGGPAFRSPAEEEAERALRY